MSLTSNLMHAEAAVKYVEAHLRGRASNKPEDIAHTMLHNLRQQWDHIDPLAVLDHIASRIAIHQRTQQIYQARVPAIRDAREARNIAGERLDSSAIIRDGLGNCFEHSVLACSFLNGKGISSYIVDTDDDTDHVFVVIGMAAGYAGNTINVPPNNNPGLPLATGDSVVCDPWYHEWFGLQQQWAYKMNRILETTNKRQGGLPAQIPLTFTDAAGVT